MSVIQTWVPVIMAVLSTGGGRLCSAAGLPLAELADGFGIGTVRVAHDVTRWEAPDIAIAFHAGTRRMTFNGVLLWLNDIIATNGAGQRVLSETDAETLLVPLLDPRPIPMPDPFTVILDPGHGGYDPGAVVSNIPPEKTLTLDLAFRIRRRLTACGRIRVRLTRDDDRTLSLSDRTSFAHRHKGAVLVSIHANKALSRRAHGIETFVLPAPGYPSTSASDPVDQAYPGNAHDAANTQLAYLIHRELSDQTAAVDRGVKRARYELLRNAPCPSALVEVGFLSHGAEGLRLQQDDYRERIAAGIAHGIRLYMLQNTPGHDGAL